MDIPLFSACKASSQVTFYSILEKNSLHFRTVYMDLLFLKFLFFKIPQINFLYSLFSTLFICITFCDTEFLSSPAMKLNIYKKNHLNSFPPYYLFFSYSFSIHSFQFLVFTFMQPIFLFFPIQMLTSYIFTISHTPTVCTFMF